MYREFYGFTTYPFTLTPDPQFLYPHKNFTDCLDYLFHGLERESGLFVLTGDIGTGKTLLLKTLIKTLDQTTHVALLVHSSLEFFDILQYLSQELQLDTTGYSKAELLFNLKKVLLTCEMKHEKVILIIDEAHNVSVDVLEELRLLTNFEHDGKTLLQIILAGHLQIEETLQLPRLHQLRQRIGVHYRLLPMNAHESRGFIEKRLSVAGATYPVFTEKALQEIEASARGIPRIINSICDLALLAGFTEEKRRIDQLLIKKVVQELHLSPPERHLPSPPSPRQDTVAPTGKTFWRRGALLLAAGLAVGGLFVVWTVVSGSLYRPEQPHRTTSAPTSLVTLPPPAAVREQPLLPQDSPLREPLQKLQWAQTTLAYHMPPGQLVTMPLPQLQHTPHGAAIKVILDTPDGKPPWLTFDPSRLTLSGVAPPQATGQSFALTFRAYTPDNLESRLYVTLTIIPHTRP